MDKTGFTFDLKFWHISTFKVNLSPTLQQSPLSHSVVCYCKIVQNDVQAPNLACMYLRVYKKDLDMEPPSATPIITRFHPDYILTIKSHIVDLKLWFLWDFTAIIITFRIFFVIKILDHVYMLNFCRIPQLSLIIIVIKGKFSIISL